MIMLAGCTANEPKLDLGADAGAIYIQISEDMAEYVRLAAKDLSTDLEKIRGERPAIGEGNVVGINIRLSVDTTLGDWERFTIDIDPADRRIEIVGTCDRALQHGIYYFTEHYLGVDPLYFWSGLEPERQASLVLGATNYDSGEPDFRFRGWFINDEDLLTEWMDSGGERNIRYPYYGQVVNPAALARVVEAAARLRFNLIIPASFLDIDNPPDRALVDEAAKRGLYVSMHHIEPLGVSAFTYENYWAERGEEPLFSYHSEPEKVEEAWRHYAERWSAYPNVIWQVGLRGIGDRPMWMADPGVPQSDADRAGIISDAMATQREIIREVTGREDPLMTTTLWAEGSYFNQRGLLDIPEDVITVFADNNSGWHWQADFYETEREDTRDYGVYYHHQLWGWGPHLAQAIPPWQTEQVMREAYTHGARDYAIMNVSNVREFLPGLAASAEMLWDMEGFDGHDFLDNWCAERFPGAADLAAEAYATYFDGYAGFGEYGLPGFLDGQSRGKGLGILRKLDRIVEQSTRTTPERGGKAPDPFHAALGGANPTGGTSGDTLLLRLEEQIAAFARADSLAALAVGQLEDSDGRQLLHDNLRTHAQIQIAIGRWLASLMRAEDLLRRGQGEEAIAMVETAAVHLSAVAEAKQAAAHGKWEHWYRGDRKMNVPAMLAATREAVKDLSESPSDE
jgi:hypothetical protein